MVYKNLLNDKIEIIEKNLKNNKWELYLKLKEGNRSNYSMVFPDGMIGHNALEFSFKQSEEEWFVVFHINGSGNGNGTILLKAMLRKIDEFEKQNSVKIILIRGLLSKFDKGPRWNKSIPFYMNFPSTFDVNETNKKVTVAVHRIDKSKPFELGPAISVEELNFRNEDAYIIFIIK